MFLLPACHVSAASSSNAYKTVFHVCWVFSFLFFFICIWVDTSDTETAHVDSVLSPDQHTILTLRQKTLSQKLL